MKIGKWIQNVLTKIKDGLRLRRVVRRDYEDEILFTLKSIDKRLESLESCVRYEREGRGKYIKAGHRL